MGFASFLRENAGFLAAGALMTFTSSYGQTFFISIFAGRIMDEFALSAGGWGAIYSAATTVSAGAMIVAGTLADRVRVRVLGALVLTGLAAACLAMAAVPSVWLLPVVVFALRFFGQGMLSHVAITAMARWYVATRGRAMAIASLGFTLGEALLPLTFVALLAVAPWRALWLIPAALALAAIWPTMHLLRRERTPQQASAEGGATGLGDRHWTRSEVLGHRLFWFVVPSILGPAAWGTAFFFQQVHLAEVKGWSHLHLVALFPLWTTVAVAATLSAGWAIDRFGAARLMPVYLLPMAAGFALIGWAPTLQWAALALAAMAVSQGTSFALLTAFWAETYGTVHVGAIKAVATATMVLGTAVGPALTGVLIDAGLPFPAQTPYIAAYLVVAAALARAGLAGNGRATARTAGGDR